MTSCISRMLSQKDTHSKKKVLFLWNLNDIWENFIDMLPLLRWLHLFFNAVVICSDEPTKSHIHNIKMSMLFIVHFISLSKLLCIHRTDWKSQHWFNHRFYFGACLKYTWLSCFYPGTIFWIDCKKLNLDWLKGRKS